MPNTAPQRIERLLSQGTLYRPIGRVARTSAASAVVALSALATVAVAHVPQDMPKIKAFVLSPVPALSIAPIAVETQVSIAAPQAPLLQITEVQIAAAQSATDAPPRTVSNPPRAPNVAVADSAPLQTASLPAETALTCIDDVHERSDEAFIVNDTTFLVHLPGDGYKRITVVNHPLEPVDDIGLRRPYAICLQDRLAPFGLEPGVSVVTEIAAISNAEADALRAIDFVDRVRYKALPANRINFSRAGRIGDLCNDTRLTVYQIKQCTRMMRAAQTADERDDVRDTVRATIKKRQAVLNRSVRNYSYNYYGGYIPYGEGTGYVPVQPTSPSVQR